MARIVVTSKLAEHRIDNPPAGHALAINRAARVDRLNLANYDLRGRRLLPWYRAVNLAYWIVVAGLCLWGVYSF
jgi:hypothetical protein